MQKLIYSFNIWYSSDFLSFNLALSWFSHKLYKLSLLFMSSSLINGFKPKLTIEAVLILPFSKEYCSIKLLNGPFEFSPFKILLPIAIFENGVIINSISCCNLGFTLVWFKLISKNRLASNFNRLSLLSFWGNKIPVTNKFCIFLSLAIWGS